MRARRNREGRRSALCSFVAVSLMSFALPAMAQRIVTNEVKPTKYVAVTDEKSKLQLFQGFTLSADVLGPAMYALGDYGSVEAALRLNLRNTYFPIAELGYGKCDTRDGNTDITYKASAPYMRFGVDLNLLKDKYQDNRLFVGARYGISKFSYDMSVPEMTDPVWGGVSSMDYKGLDATVQWLELVFGVQVKIWRNFHMGWSVRMKKKLSTDADERANPYYVPGYGTTVSGTSWGGTYSLIFDLNWGKKKKGGKRIEIKDLPTLEEKADTVSVSQAE